jgi:hypothetical protein
LRDRFARIAHPSEGVDMHVRSAALALAFSATLAAALPAPAGAQQVPQAGYRQWQPAWDRFEYDRRHVILGTVTRFEPFRLQIARPDGAVQTIDLKNGTVIRPTGTTPMAGERVAVEGYYSRGTFVANRVLVHP